MEAVGFYKGLLERLNTRCDGKANVSYSQGPGLGEVVKQASVAVTYASTTFLDCLQHRVPIVSFAWHNFSYKRQIEQYGVFHFARDLDGLVQLVTDGLNRELQPYAGSIEDFLAPVSATKAKQFFKTIIKPIAGLREACAA